MALTKPKKSNNLIYILLAVVIVIVLVYAVLSGGLSSVGGPAAQFTVGGTGEVTVQMAPGWNMISVPFHDATYTTSGVCESNNLFFNYNPLKTTTNKIDVVRSLDTLKPGIGYLVKYTSACSITFSGSQPVTTSDLGNNADGSLKGAWNMVAGAIDENGNEKDNILTKKGTCDIKAAFFVESVPKADGSGYAAKISLKSEIEAGKGYFIKPTADCQLDQTTLIQSQQQPAEEPPVDVVDTVAGTDTQVPQAVPSDSEIPPTPLLEIIGETGA